MILTEAKDLRRGDVIPGLGLVTGVRVDPKMVAVRIDNDGPRLVKYRKNAWVKIAETSTTTTILEES